LEDYFRLWTPGLAALMKVLPANYTVQLTLSGDGQIRIFRAYEPNGGTNYLFDETTASNQVANSTSLYVGLLSSSSPIIFNIQTNFNEHFIFCGAHAGSAQVDLQILDANQNIVADSPAYLQINEIKQMYERWTVGDDLNKTPTSVAIKATDGLQTNPPVPAFQYLPPTDTTTPYILFVHGWNMQTWEKDRYAEAAYKRLYWQRYQGRFGEFRWPTGNGFSGKISALFDARNYDNSESNAWASATGLTNLLTQLNAEYPGHVYLMAHSMGNVVAGEALRLASSQLVNTYVAMQGAVPAHCYDATTANRSSSGPPDRYAAYWTNGAPCYFNGTAGAGSYINFYNTNDWALGYWNLDQDPFKPDNSGVPFPGYYYTTPSGTHPSGFYKIIGSTDYDLYFPASTYEIFAYADRAWSYALGAQANVGGSFQLLGVPQQVNLPSVWPIDTHPQIDNKSYSAHVWHSAEFRSDNMSRVIFWNTVLKRMNISP
jgi:pimeloyl-ACP methyl ester carboxylesterase